MGNIHTVGPNEALIVSGKVLSTGNQYSSDDVMTEFESMLFVPTPLYNRHITEIMVKNSPPDPL